MASGRSSCASGCILVLPEHLVGRSPVLQYNGSVSLHSQPPFTSRALAVSDAQDAQDASKNFPDSPTQT